MEKETPKKVLIIEDDFSIRELYRLELTREGFEVIIAVDGAKGLWKAKNLKPDLILLDIMLPKLDGLAVLRALKREDETKDIPVVLLSNLGHEAVIKEGLSLGVIGYFIKAAYTPSQIIKEIKNFLKMA